MKNFLFLILFSAITFFIGETSFALSNSDFTYFSEKELLSDLTYSERQVFKKTYSKEDMENRLERLEIMVYGAIQSGETDIRIKKLKKAVTNISQGGNGLQYNTGMTNLTGMNGYNSTWQVRNYNNNYHTNHSHRLPPPKNFHSHRLPPPPPPNYNNNPIQNGDGTMNYSLGTNVRILSD